MTSSSRSAPERLRRVVAKLVRARVPFGKVHDVARRELTLALRRAQGRAAADDDEELLASQLPVIRPELLARRRLVERCAETFRSELLADSCSAMPIPGTTLRIVELVAEQ